MGYPATGVAALYRNKRQDVLKFITSRHGEKWWIWNLSVNPQLLLPVAELTVNFEGVRCMRMLILPKACTIVYPDILSQTTTLRLYRSYR